MIEAIKKAVNKNAWLFLAAAWLYTLSFIFTNYLSYSSSAQKVANILSEYIKGQENSFENILHDSAAVNAIISDRPAKIKDQLVTDAQGIFAYQVNDRGTPIEIFWNTNKMSVENTDLLKHDGNSIVQYQNGIFEYIKSSVNKGGITYFFCTLIPVRWQYFMQNEYLQPGFAVHEEIGNTYEITDEKYAAAVKGNSGNILFRIKEKSQVNNNMPGGFSIFLRIIAVIFLLLFVNNIAAETVQNRNIISGFVLLISLFIIIRLIIFFSSFSFNYQNTRLFDPALYAAGNINRSLGDLFINAVLILWFIIFSRKYLPAIFPLKKQMPPLLNQLLFISVLIFIPLLTFYVTNIISSLVTDSSISFNSSDFFSLSFYSFTGFIIICILLYLWLYIVGLLLSLLSKSAIPFFWQTVSITACGFLIITLNVFAVQSELLLFVSIFLIAVLFVMKLKNNPSLSSLVSSSYFIIWALILTASASALIIYQNSITEKKSRIKIAQSIQQETDSSGALLLRMALANFSDEFLQKNFYRFQSEYTNKFIKDSLENENFSAFLNKYITRIYVFDKYNHSLHNDDSVSYDVISSVVENKGKATAVPGLFYYKNKPGSFNYIYKKKIWKDSVFQGSLFVLVQPKFYKNDALVPELFKQTNDITAQVDKGYVFGVYENRKLTNSYTGFNFADSITQQQIPATEYYYKDSLGYNQLWYNAGNAKLLIIAKKNNWFFNFITLFAYLFVLFIILAFTVHKSRRVLESRNRNFKLGNIFRFNIRTQIQTTIIGVSILSFLIIGVATISFFILRFNKSTISELENASQIIVNEIEQTVKSEIIRDDAFDINNVTVQGDLEKEIARIAVIHNTDINFYAKNGSLLVSSQPYIYSKEILSDKINSRAFYEMHYRHSTRFVHSETIGNFSYQSIYMPVKDETDETIAYINIPSLSSQNELKEEISDFLITLIILNALIFIFAGAIAVTLTGRITSSLELIGSKMKEINIGRTNEEILWKENDEIGMLIDEYNKMVKKLDQSAGTLAKSEREGAWREMARQVAHEIKNPLTPMKLSVQYLQRAMEQKAPNIAELSQKVTSTLIEQIDQLSKIAGDFSQFANIENIKPERFDLSEVIRSLINLYNTDERLKVTWKNTSKNSEVISDKTQMNRLFTNLIKNAEEASAQKNISIIHIRQYNENNSVIVSLQDNGNGIDEILQSKIFDPNFTTKSSGTGLGLAICKAILEKANGKIWFTTAQNEGTVFYVQLPLADS